MARAPNNLDRGKQFSAFVEWSKVHIKGRERAEAQIFLNKLLQTFGHQGALEAGATFEDPVKKKSGKTGFVDLLWKPRVIVEMKGRGEPLRKHYPQAAEYWIRLVPNRPQYMVLCNFDEFWVYDLNVQVDDPVHILKTENLAEEYVALSFLFPKPETPIFNNNNVEVTEKAAGIIGSIYQSLLKRKVEPERAQRFVLQIVVALFSEDVGLIPEYTVYRILEGIVKDPMNSEQIFVKEMKALFQAMATAKIGEKPKKYSEIPYFNGGLFTEFAPVELKFKEIDLLVGAAKEDWSRVRPSIFGSIFESSLDPKKRHENGVHYTHEIDIYKIVNPTIVKPFRDRIENAKKKDELKKILKEISNFRVLDPACGSGNFLYIAFRELRRLEFEILERLEKNFDPKQMRSFPFISPKNFYGIDTNKFGLELAKIALSVGRKLSADEFNINEKVLPFDDLEENFSSEDALFHDWPKVNAIVGNPPFLGKREMRKELGDHYVETVRKKFLDMPGTVDFCSYWFRLAHDADSEHCGLVGTNSVAQGFTREATLDYILKNGGYIHNAISTQEWEGQAAVHVSIVNWVKKVPRECYLDGKKVDFINSSLKFEVDVTNALRLLANKKKSYQGCNLTGKGFIVSPAVAKSWILQDQRNSEVLKPMLDGRSVVDPNAELDWVIDFNDFTIERASTYELPFKKVKSDVKPERDNNKRETRKIHWWHFGEKAPNLRNGIQDLKCYFAISQISKYTCFRAVDVSVLPCEATMVVASDDFYILGVLNSKLHLDWVIAQGSTLKADRRYTNTTCFETFPFLWNPPKAKAEQIRAKAKELEAVRVTICREHKITFTELYNQYLNEPTSLLYKLHHDLDVLVCDLYGLKLGVKNNFNEDMLRLNLEMAKKERSGQK